MGQESIRSELRRLTRRRFLAITGGSAAALLLGGCAAPAATPAPTSAPAAPAAPPPPTSAPAAAAPTSAAAPAAAPAKAAEWGPAEMKKVAWSTWATDISNSAPIYIGLDKGWYEEEGLEVEVVDTDQGMEGVVSGSIHFARQDTGPAIAAWQEGVKIKVLAPWRTAESLVYVVKNSIKTVKDMEGKVMLNYPIGDRFFVLTLELMKEAGYDTSTAKIDWRQMPGGSDAKALAFVDGRIDGTYTHQDLVEKMTTPEADGRVLYNKLLKWPQESMIASEEFIAKNPNTCRRFMRATIRGMSVWTDIKQKDYVLQMMTTKYNFKADPSYSKYYEGEIIQFEGDMGFDLADWKRLIENYMIGRTGVAPTAQQLYDVRFLNEAQVSLGMKPRPTL